MNAPNQGRLHRNRAQMALVGADFKVLTHSMTGLIFAKAPWMQLALNFQEVP
jgi:hypothetical protein